ncbi:MAG: helix-turn-helix domain-containing protein [Solirubrobacterales bacterium]
MEAGPASAERITPRPELISPQLAAAMSHPTRVRAMCIFNERAASPREIAAEIDEPLNNVTYHVNQLRELGCIELVRTERARGGRVLERFYGAVQRAYFDEEAWEVLSEKERLGVSSTVIKIIAKDIAVAMAAGTFFARDGLHACRSVLQVDDEGWREIASLLERMNSELFEVEERVAQRAADGDPPSINAKVEFLQFRSPPDSGA